MRDYYLFQLDPTLFRVGGVGIGWYVVMFALCCVSGVALWLWQMWRGGYDRKVFLRFAPIGTLWVIVGARLGQVFFYNPDIYLANPIEILKIWEGGLASHGAFVSMALAFTYFAHRHGYSVLDMFDRFMPSATFGSACVRVGNFLNSEIVGRETDVPWAVRFMYYDSGRVPRHPVQLYEAGLLLLTFAVVMIVDARLGERRPAGLLTGLFSVVYFGGRFFLEFAKQPLKLDAGSAYTLGQFLSLVPVAFGILLFARSGWISRAR